MRMPSKRLVATAGVLIVLAAGFGSAVSAQSEEPLDPMGANYWTGTWTYIEGSFTPGARPRRRVSRRAWGSRQAGRSRPMTRASPGR